MNGVMTLRALVAMTRNPWDINIVTLTKNESGTLIDNRMSCECCHDHPVELTVDSQLK